jgi:hypothetical protein
MTEYISKPKLFDGDGDDDGEGDILSRKLESVVSSSAAEMVVNLESLSIHESTTGGVVYKKTSQQADRQKIDPATDDPLLMARDIEVKYEESLTIRPEDESRIVGVSQYSVVSQFTYKSPVLREIIITSLGDVGRVEEKDKRCILHVSLIIIL